MRQTSIFSTDLDKAMHLERKALPKRDPYFVHQYQIKSSFPLPKTNPRKKCTMTVETNERTSKLLKIKESYLNFYLFSALMYLSKKRIMR